MPGTLQDQGEQIRCLEAAQEQSLPLSRGGGAGVPDSEDHQFYKATPNSQRRRGPPRDQDGRCPRRFEEDEAKYRPAGGPGSGHSALRPLPGPKSQPGPSRAAGSHRARKQLLREGKAGQGRTRGGPSGRPPPRVRACLRSALGCPGTGWARRGQIQPPGDPVCRLLHLQPSDPVVSSPGLDKVLQKQSYARKQGLFIALSLQVWLSSVSPSPELS